MKIYAGDIGTVFEVDTGVDITTATKAALRVRLPNNKSVEWVGAVTGMTKVRYAVLAGDLPIAGIYLLQAYIEMPSWSGHGETVQIKVSKAFH